MGVVLSFLLTFAALLMWALSMDRHHRQAFRQGVGPRKAKLFHLLASLLALAAPVPWVAEHGATMGLVTWLFCATPLAGIAVVALFTGLARRGRPSRAR